MKEKENLMDKRVVLNNIIEGLVDRTEYDKFLSQLPDVSGKAVEISINEIAPKSYMKSLRGAYSSDKTDKESEEENPGDAEDE